MHSPLVVALLLGSWACLGAWAEGSGKGERQGKQSGTSDQTSLPLMNRGVYMPDSRFNPFVDGVMANMVAEMRRMELDPLYFRVTDQGEVLHVPVQRNEVDETPHFRRSRMTGSASLGGGMVKGLMDIKRHFDAGVQKVGNATMVKSSWVIGPLAIIVDYRGSPTITRVITSLEAIQMNTLTAVDKFGAEKKELTLNSPLFEYMPYYGNRTMHQQRMTELVVKYLFSKSSFLVKYLNGIFELASFDKIIPQFGSTQDYHSVLEYLANTPVVARSLDYASRQRPARRSEDSGAGRGIILGDNGGGDEEGDWEQGGDGDVLAVIDGLERK